MIWDTLLELKENIDRHGIRFGILLTLYAVYRKELRNVKLDKRDEAMFQNQLTIMRKLGVDEHWHGPVKTSIKEEAQNLKRSYELLREAINREFQSRRRRRMQINKVILVPLLSAVGFIVKLATGYTIPNPAFDIAADIILAAANLIGILMHPTQPQQPSQPQSQDYGPNSFK